MKLFGTGGSGRTQKAKAPKTPLTKKQKTVRIVVSVVAVLLALVATGCAVWFTQVKPPKTPVVPSNNQGIQDVDNGDAPEIDMGDRVADYFTFFVGAVDEDQTRTDAMMVCGFDTQKKEINILNIPRDTMSNNGKRGANRKINAAYGTKKGIEQTKTEVKKLVGFAPDYYIIVNFKGIADIVDAIGGVDYEIPFRMYYKDPSQNLSIDFKPGMTHMDGQQVVEFLRWRKNNGGVKTGDPNYTGGDEERIDKQQEFLKYLAAQVLNVKNTANIPKIAKAVFENVKTDFTWGEMLWMGMQAVGTSSDGIKMHKLPGYDSMSYAGSSDYLSFFFPNERETLELVNTYFNPYVNKLTNLDIVSGPDKASRPSSSGNKTGSSGSSSKPKPEETEKPEQTEPTTPGTTDPEAGTTPTPPTDTGNGGTTGGGTTQTPPTDGGTGGATGGDTVTPPADSGTSGGTTTPPADTGSTGGSTTPPPTAPTTPPVSSVDPEA